MTFLIHQPPQNIFCFAPYFGGINTLQRAYFLLPFSFIESIAICNLPFAVLILLLVLTSQVGGPSIPFPPCPDS